MITAAAQLFDDVQAIPSRDCRFCGKPFLSVDQRVYCSNVCRSRRKYSSPRRREREKERREHASMLGPHDRHVRVYRKWLMEEQAAARVARLGWKRRAHDDEHRQALSWGSAQVEYGGYGWNTQRCNICHAEFIAGAPRVTCGDAECATQLENKRSTARRKERRDEINARRRARDANNREYIRAVRHAWYWRNREHVLARTRDYMERNPDYVERNKARKRLGADIAEIVRRARDEGKRARRHGVNPGKITEYYSQQRDERECYRAWRTSLAPDDPRCTREYFLRNRKRIAAHQRKYGHSPQDRWTVAVYRGLARRKYQREYKLRVRAAVFAYRELTGVIERDDLRWRNAVVIYKALQQFMEGEEADEHAAHRDESTSRQRDAEWPFSVDDTACAAEADDGGVAQSACA